MLPVAAAAFCIRASDTALQERYDVSTLTLCLCLWCLPARVQDLAAVASAAVHLGQRQQQQQPKHSQTGPLPRMTS
jgi:hypothetical protein